MPLSSFFLLEYLDVVGRKGNHAWLEAISLQSPMLRLVARRTVDVCYAAVGRVLWHARQRCSCSSRSSSSHAAPTRKLTALTEYCPSDAENPGVALVAVSFSTVRLKSMARRQGTGSTCYRHQVFKTTNFSALESQTTKSCRHGPLLECGAVMASARGSALPALVASAALFASSGAFMLAPPVAVSPVALSASCHYGASPAAAARRASAGRMAPAGLRSGAGAWQLRMGILDDILDRKQTEVAALKDNLPKDAAVLLEKGAKKKKSGFLKAIKKPKGTISVIGLMKTRSPNTGEFAEIPAPDFLSAHMYEAGAAACCVCVDEPAYGMSYDDLAAVAKQQSRYKGNFPGPLPILAFDFFIDECQLAVAASKGALAVNLNVALYKGDVDHLKRLLEAAEKMGMDALTEVHNKEELDCALAAGSKIVGVCNRNMDTFELQTPSDFQTRVWTKPFEETVYSLVSDIPDDVVKVAMGGVNETLTAWTLRDEGYSSVIVGEGIVRGSEMRMSTGDILCVCVCVCVCARAFVCVVDCERGRVDTRG